MGKISYMKLRIELVKRGLKISDIGQQLGLSSATIAKINKDEYVSIDTIVRIGELLNIDIGDMMEIKKDH